MGRAIVLKKIKKPFMTTPGITRRKTDEEFHQKVLEKQRKIDVEEKNIKKDKDAN